MNKKKGNFEISSSMKFNMAIICLCVLALAVAFVFIIFKYLLIEYPLSRDQSFLEQKLEKMYKNMPDKVSKDIMA